MLIVGGGFGGLAVAKSLRGVNANVDLLDRQNHHVFQPLLYQVATASLSPASISAPIRSILSDDADCEVVLDTVVGIDVDQRRVHVDDGTLPYDYLVLAVGARHDYFGHDEWERVAPGLKTISDATGIRRRMLLAFESAEQEGDASARRAALTFVIVGGGPTGVELAGAIKSIASRTLPREYKNIDTTTARVILFQGGDRVLESFPEELSERAKRDLEDLGVEVELGRRVTDVDDSGVRVGEDFIPARNVFWAAGVKANPLTQTLGAELDRSGRVIVGGDLSVPGHPEVFVIGDAASYTPEGAERALPGVAQVAMQMGRYVGGVIREELEGGESKRRGRAFAYRDKGSMAIIGKNRAVAAIGKSRFRGFVAWLLWALVHIAFLVGFRNRLRVMFNWMVGWLMDSHDARLIVGDTRIRLRQPLAPGFESAESDERADVSEEAGSGTARG